MLIKLQANQIVQFWEATKVGMIESYGIPKDFQQDFAVEALSDLLTGMAQSWVGIHVDDEGNRRLHYTLTSKIVDDKHYGSKSLFIDSFKSFMLIKKKVIIDAYEIISNFAKSNGCDYLAAMRKDEKVEKIFIDLDFKLYNTLYRKNLV